ncbi:hypothetical protein Patl1_17858 [Pistacia atlantica]|uniref:Uncharacterized protein n=1 Tax=Pistacia atlantica TaxID=434234 RepID=A0ACC1C1H1_9ROSI|nr:hypothetical protein Patl1_17858 [Pistacia atlantica]
MAGGRMYTSGNCSGSGDGSSLCVLIQSQKGARSSQPLDSPFLSASTSSPFLGSRSMVSFEDIHLANGSNKSFFRPFEHDENGDEDFDETSLNPERKVQLAKDLGLQPRQVAIWFQNRRARWKTKRLEKDYDILQTSYNNLKADYDNLLKEKDKLKAEVVILTDKLHLKEKETGKTELCNVNQHIVTRSKYHKSLLLILHLRVKCQKFQLWLVNKKISVRREVTSLTQIAHITLMGFILHCWRLVIHLMFLNLTKSDLSQDEDDNLSKNFLPPYIFPKLEEADYSDPPTSSCNFGFPIEDHSFWPWSY